ncbi:DUF6241 domain-containing protein [Neobacillus pocheonensis]|uniref:DUF6241 domain-containing protein n=1 Tax=Neobacillus pocheonensis TaxID=363869 RepID=A0ABT0W784_9BACI|nr:DUF6241 domain-containing protein [Neobacillus pocheonensis]
MTTYFKKFTKVQLSMVMIAVICIGIYFYYSSHGSLPFFKEVVTVKEQQTEDGNTVIKVKDTSTDVANEFPMDMSEDAVLDAIHKMSHQKVESDQKWGAIPLTPERVNRLIAVVENNQSNYVHADLYLIILERWAKNDFSHVVQDHNDIWGLQGGTIGKAYGISTPAEEEAFIKDNFKIAQ